MKCTCEKQNGTDRIRTSDRGFMKRNALVKNNGTDRIQASDLRNASQRLNLRPPNV
uniref:Uncharacterized protein n=1 Tax=Arion vulgaris TaxID=1028688 RepID=A0A0B7B119_9EUPU